MKTAATKPSWRTNLPPDASELYTAWQKRLVDKNYSKPPRQTRHQKLERIQTHQSLLLAASQSSKALATEVRKGIRLLNVNLGVPTLKVPLLAGELKHPHYHWELSLHKALDIAREDAARPIYWALSHIHWLETAKLPDPPYEALNIPAVEKRLLSQDPTDIDEEDRRLLDRAIRYLLRNTGGIGHVRDWKAFVYDCPGAAAWWRVEVSKMAAGATDQLQEEAVHRVLTNRPRWQELVSKTMRNFGVLSAPQAVAAFGLACLRHEKAHNKLPTRSEARGMLENLARRTAGISLSLMAPAELVSLCFDDPDT